MTQCIITEGLQAEALNRLLATTSFLRLIKDKEGPHEIV